MENKRRDFLRKSSAAALGLWIHSLLPYKELIAEAINSNDYEMIYREYGKTGKMVSTLGFGGMRFDTEPVEKGNLDSAAKLVVEAYRKGVNYFDTAPIYVKDKSEEIMGLAFQEIDRIMKNENIDLPYYFTSKSGYSREKTADEVLKRLEKSLKRLNKDKIHFYHMWCIMDKDHYDNVMKKGGPYEGALKAKKEGLIDHIVFSSHASGKETTEMVKDGFFEGILYGYNVLNYQRGDQVLQAAHEQNMGFVAMNPLAGGLIPQHEKYFSDKIKKIHPEMTLVQSALAFIMGQESATCALSGISNLEQLNENLNTLKFIKIFNDSQITQLKKDLSSQLTDICTNCRYCDVCPFEIPVYEIMNIYNTFILKGKEDTLELINKYKGWGLNVEEQINKCISCGLCEKACTQKLPIVKRFSEFNNLFFTNE